MKFLMSQNRDVVITIDRIEAIYITEDETVYYVWAAGVSTNGMSVDRRLAQYPTLKEAQHALVCVMNDLEDGMWAHFKCSVFDKEE